MDFQKIAKYSSQLIMIRICHWHWVKILAKMMKSLLWYIKI